MDGNPPNKCSEEYYNELKYSPVRSAERGFLGVVASYGCIFFGGDYRLKYQTRNDYLKQGVAAIEKIRPAIKNVTFMDAQSYDKLNPVNSLIYCDPPYLNNKYSRQTEFFKFDHDKFWDVMRLWSESNLVFISEATAPVDFVCIWTRPYNQTIGKSNTTYNENLYLFKNIYDKLTRLG